MSKQCNKNKKAHLYASGGMDIGGMALGTMQFADGLTSYKKEREANEELYNNAIDNTRIGFNNLSSINNLDDLESQLGNYNQLHEIGTDDLIGNDANRLGKYLSVSSQAAQAGGASGNAFGFLAGSIIGQLGAGWASWRNKKKAKEAVDDINQRVRDTNELYASMTNNRLNNIMQNQMSENQWNYIAALGGNLHSNSTTWDNGLNYIGAGGSHESNPNDGVAISTAPDGLENKVEEGEVVWNNEYVFSKRLIIPEKDKKANKWKGKTYADVAKKLMEDSEERPNDPITLRGLDDSLSRLRDSQDELKAKQEERKIKKEIASMPPEMLAQLQQQAQQPTEEEMAQQAAMEQQQMPIVDSSMQQPMMEQPPMYAKGGHLFFGGGNGLGVNIDYTTGNSPINSYGSKPQRPLSIYGNSLQQTFNPSNTVSVDMSGKYGSVGQNIQANSNGFSNPTLQGETKTSSGNGINKGAMFQGIAQGINMIGAGFQSAGYKGGDLNALYKGTKHNDMFGDKMHKAMNRYLNIGLMPSMFAKGGHLHAYDPYLDFANQKQAYFANPYNDSLILSDIARSQNLKRMSQMNQDYDLTNYKDAYTDEFNRDYALQKAIEDSQLNKRNSYLTQDYDLSDYKTGYYNSPEYSRAIKNTLSDLSLLQRKNPELFASLTPELIRSSKGKPEGLSYDEQVAKNIAERDAKNAAKKQARKDKVKSALSNFDETSLRYAPVLGSIFNVARSIANRPDYGNPERIERAAAQVGAPVSPKYIGDYLQYRPLDEAYYLNQLNAQQNAANNAIVGLSNGNRSMALASMLANDYNYNTQRGNAYRQGLEYNDVNRLRFGEFNRGTNQFNAQQHLSAAAQSAQNRAQAANLIASAAQMREGIDNAYGASQSANWTSLFNNLGAVGKDRMNWNMAKDIYDYQTGRNGEVKYKPAAKGGYLTIKTNNRRKE